MLRQHKQSVQRTFRLVDLCIILFWFYLAYSIRLGPLGLDITVLPIHYQLFFSAFLVTWILVSSRFQLYGSKRLIGFSGEASDIIKTTTVCFLISILLTFFIKEKRLSRLFLLYLWPSLTTSLILFRFVAWSIVNYIRTRGYNFRHAVIVGRNPRAETIATKLEQNPQLGIHILGFIDAPNGQDAYYASRGFNLLGNLDDLEDIVREHVVDEVFITLPIKSFYGKIEEIIGICEKVGIDAKVQIDLFDKRPLAKTTLSPDEIIPVIDLHTTPRMGWKLIVKRIIDMLGSLVLLILLSPLFVVVGILIKITSKGPIFFRQQRVGYNGRMFTCLKLRTMVDNAEELKQQLVELNEMDGPVFKMKEDPRITNIGRFLRKTSIDELPQLINVFVGDMSLVGPRPPVPSEVDQYDLQERRRLSMKPGITCLWQVSGRNAIDFKQWMEMDRQYIDRWSLWLDMKILVKTIPAVMKGS